MKTDYDVVVIGGGAAGLFAASVANALGARTLMVDKERLGGDCTWFGCMPSKAILNSAHTANTLKNFKNVGLKLKGSIDIETDKVMDYVRGVVDEIATHHPREIFEKRGIKVEFGVIRFVDKKTLELNGKLITTRKVILCTGTHPIIPAIEGLSKVKYFTNETIFNLKKLPESLIVLGGGPIGLELSQSLSRLGVKVSIVEAMDRILFREEKEASTILEKKLKSEGINVFIGKKAVSVEKKDGNLVVILVDKNGELEEISAQNILVAVGRAPNLENISLENSGVEYTNKGIKVNKYLQTTNKNVFACGDIVGPYMFSHVAAYQASVCVRNALLKKFAWTRVNYSNVSWAIFTDPEVAHLGLTETEAKEKYKTVKIYKVDYAACDRAITDSEKKGLVKVIVDKKGYILGASVIGAKAGEVIQGFIIAKSFKLPLHKLALIMYIYPTLCELVKKVAAKSLIERMNNPLLKLVLKLIKK